MLISSTSGAGGAGRVDAECASNVSAAEVGAAPELVTGLGVTAAAGTELCAGPGGCTEGLATILSPTPSVPCSGSHPMGSSLQRII